MYVLLVTGKWLFRFLASDWPCDALPLSSPFSPPLPPFCLFLSLSLAHLLAPQLPLLLLNSLSLPHSPPSLPPSLSSSSKMPKGTEVPLLAYSSTNILDVRRMLHTRTGIQRDSIEVNKVYKTVSLLGYIVQCCVVYFVGDVLCN